MTLSSASVDVSPMFLSPAAIFLSIRLMILPDLVFGSAGACWMTSGCANGPILSRTVETYFLIDIKKNVEKNKSTFYEIYLSFSARSAVFHRTSFL